MFSPCFKCRNPLLLLCDDGFCQALVCSGCRQPAFRRNRYNGIELTKAEVEQSLGFKKFWTWYAISEGFIPPSMNEREVKG